MNNNERCLKLLKDNYGGVKLPTNIRHDPDGFIYTVTGNIVVSVNRRWMGVIWINDKNEELTFMVNATNDYSKIDNDEERNLVKNLIELISPYF